MSGKFNLSGAKIKKCQIGENNTMVFNEKKKEKGVLAIYEYDGELYHSNSLCQCEDEENCFQHGNKISKDDRKFDNEIEICIDGEHEFVPGNILDGSLNNLYVRNDEDNK